MADQFFWYDLMTTDVEGAKAFYKALIGWDTTEFGGGPTPYTIIEASGRGVGGIMPLPPEAAAGGMKPGWIGYIHVRDIDAKVAAIQAEGGMLMKGPEPIPTVGRFAVVADPQGTAFMLLQPDGPDMPELPRGTTGKIDWNELHSSDWKAGYDFYAKLFGWSITRSMDMGPMGTYNLFTMGSGQEDGGMMNNMEGPRPYWMFYITVPSADAAVATINEKGGKVLMGPHEVPGGAWIVCGEDPQGAIFSITAAKR